MKNLKYAASLLIFVMIFSCLSISAFAYEKTTITADSVAATPGSTVTVPIRIENNIGICGAKLTVAYDKALSLEKIEKGEALSTLVMTKPGNLSSNPFNLVWDGMEGDTSDGTIVYLTFAVPQTCGIYEISLSYEKNFIVDGSLSPMEINIVNGSITVGDYDHAVKPTISAGEITGKAGDIVTVPVSISDNPGILGATLTFAWDSNLTLVGSVAGEAFSCLTMTKPGKFVSPCNFVWDGQEISEADIKDGVILNLQFMIAEEAPEGKYDIALSYKAGYIVDGNLKPVYPNTKNGAINVRNSDITTVTIAGNKAEINTGNNSSGAILVAFYSEPGKMTRLMKYSSTKKNINIEAVPINSQYAKIMFWEKFSNLKSLCKAQKINLK